MQACSYDILWGAHRYSVEINNNKKNNTDYTNHKNII